MQLYNELQLKFEEPLWALNPELALFDVLLEEHPEIISYIEKDVIKGLVSSTLGRKDLPTVEQILRASIFKEIKKLNYRELEISMHENLTFKLFMNLEGRTPFSFTTLHKYISKISAENIKKIIVYINTIAIKAGIETLDKVSPDTTVIETNIHHPTNNSLIWDCIKVATHLLEQYKREKGEIRNQDDETRETRRSDAKKLNYAINNEKNKEKQKGLFVKYFAIFEEIIKDVQGVLSMEKTEVKSEKKLSELLPIMQKVYNFAYRIQILGEEVKSSDKIFSIFEQHTSIIVKGLREIEYGHKAMITRGTSNLILDYEVYKGNPNDSTLYVGTIEEVIKNYSKIPHSVTSDGGFASSNNLEWSKKKGIVNTVFTKVKKGMVNIFENREIEIQLKKWRSGTEAVISNLKRGYDLQRVTWEGLDKFIAKVSWGVLCYNIRVFSSLLLSKAQR